MDTKYCKRCDKTLSAEQFTVSAGRYDGLQAYCRLCMKEYRKEHYRKNKQQYFDRNKKTLARGKEYILELKSKTPCTDCDSLFPDEPWLMEFDHLPEHAKSENISKIVRCYGYSKKLLDEIAKCELVCVLCHRRRTAARGAWKLNRFEDWL